MTSPLDDAPAAMTPVHRSLIRPDSIMGCEKMPLLMLVGIGFIFIGILHTFATLVSGVIVVAVGVPGLRLMAKRDPFMMRVYIRALLKHPQREYHAHPDIWGRVPDLPLEVK